MAASVAVNRRRIVLVRDKGDCIREGGTEKEKGKYVMEKCLGPGGGDGGQGERKIDDVRWRCGCPCAFFFAFLLVSQPVYRTGNGPMRKAMQGFCPLECPLEHWGFRSVRFDAEKKDADAAKHARQQKTQTVVSGLTFLGRPTSCNCNERAGS